MTCKHGIFGLITAVMAAFAAQADEAWDLASGGAIYYEKDIGDIAVFRIEHSDEITRYYFPGLAAALNDRGVHEGFWIDGRTASERGHLGCDTMLEGPDGLSSDAWGKIVLTFDYGSFPSGWSALVGHCFDDPVVGLRANLPQCLYTLRLYSDHVVDECYYI